MYRTLDDLNVKGSRVLVRLDLNVPMKDGKVTDATRIERQAGTLRELADRGARVIVLSHFDRPKGQIIPEMSLAPLIEPLSKAVSRPVSFASDCIGEIARNAVAALGDGHILLLENTRFHIGEEANDKAFAAELAGLGDIFVNDAFSVAHRAHASTEGIARLIPSAAGRNMARELIHLARVLESPKRPVMAVVGGAKISTKIALLENLLSKVQILVIGGAMANTFLSAQGYPVGKSLIEADQRETATQIMAAAEKKGVLLLLPLDVVVAKEFRDEAEHRSAAITDVANEEMILDIGPKTIELFGEQLQDTATIVWNGPFGAFEMTPFDAGTTAAAKLVAQQTVAGNLLSVAGGGDTVAALAKAGVLDAFTYVSTAGGAFLEWLEGRDLPGVAALEQ
ncbi:MAG: phosphoglycerate kinase [Micropepsaceae bacterium]